MTGKRHIGETDPSSSASEPAAKRSNTGTGLSLIRGSTVQILRVLYQSQIDLKEAKPEDMLILLDARAASTRSEMHSVEPLTVTREQIDDVIVKFKPEDLKAFGVGYKQQNTELSNQISQLDEMHAALIKQYKAIQEAQQVIRKAFRENENGPSKDAIAKLTSDTNEFRKNARAYLGSYAALTMDLRSLYSSVAKFVPQAATEQRPGPTPAA